jgi:hypothetical protein
VSRQRRDQQHRCQIELRWQESSRYLPVDHRQRDDGRGKGCQRQQSNQGLDGHVQKMIVAGEQQPHADAAEQHRHRQYAEIKSQSRLGEAGTDQRVGRGADEHGHERRQPEHCHREKSLSPVAGQQGMPGGGGVSRRKYIRRILGEHRQHNKHHQSRAIGRAGAGGLHQMRDAHRRPGKDQAGTDRPQKTGSVLRSQGISLRDRSRLLAQGHYNSAM